MTSIPLLVKNDFEHLEFPSQIESFGSSSINLALTAVAYEVAGLLQQFYPFQVNTLNHPEMISIQALEPECRRIVAIEPLTSRELEVLQMIVDGHSNSAIAEKLYIATGTVKTHVRNTLKKLCVSGRTQAAIRALRAGLVH